MNYNLQTCSYFFYGQFAFISAVISAFTFVTTSASIVPVIAPNAPPFLTAKQAAVDCPTRVLVLLLSVTIFVFRVVMDDWAVLTFELSVFTCDCRLFLASAACWAVTAAANAPPAPKARRVPS